MTDSLHIRPEPQGWMPIQSAPTDGTRFLAWCEAWYGEINGFDDPEPFFAIIYGPPDAGSDAKRAGCDGDWWLADGGDAYATWCRATHWMPLPPPPPTDNGGE